MLALYDDLTKERTMDGYKKWKALHRDDTELSRIIEDRSMNHDEQQKAIQTLHLYRLESLALLYNKYGQGADLFLKGMDSLYKYPSESLASTRRECGPA